MNEIYGLKFKSVNDLAKQLNVSASGINKYIKKLENKEKGIIAYLNKEGGEITVNQKTYPTVMIALHELQILPKDYKIFLAYEGCSVEDAVSYLSSEKYKKIGLPVEVNNKYFNSIISACKFYKQHYEKISMYASTYNLTLRQALQDKISETTNNKYQATKVFIIFGIKYKNKSDVFNNYDISPKTIYHFMEKQHLEFEDAVEKYLLENRMFLSEEKYIVAGKKLDTMTQVYLTLNVSKKEFKKFMSQKNLTVEETIQLLEQQKKGDLYMLEFNNKKYTNYKLLCKDNKIPFRYVANKVKSNNSSMEKEVKEFLTMRNAYRAFKALTPHQKEVIFAMFSNDVFAIVYPTKQSSSISLFKENTKNTINYKNIGISSLSYATLNALQKLGFLILRKKTPQKFFTLHVNKKFLLAVKEYEQSKKEIQKELQEV